MFGSINIKRTKLRFRCSAMWGSLVLFLLLFQAQIPSCFAQHMSQNSDNEMISPANVYKDFFDPYQLISYGKDYKFYYPRTEGTHIFRNEEGKDWLDYEGIHFKELALNYDVYHDILFVNLSTKSNVKPIILNRRKVNEFSIGMSKFIHLRTPPDSSMIPGFYEVGFDQDPIRLLIKRKRDRIASSGIKKHKFVSLDRHYLQIGEEVILVKNKKEVLEAFGLDADMKQFIKENRLKLYSKRDDFSDNLIRLLKFYAN